VIRTPLATASLSIAALSSLGAQWQYVASGTTAELRGLTVACESVAWASGSRGTFLRSTDGGVTWHADSVAGATSFDFRAIHAFDGKRAFVASAGEAEKGLARIFATNDGGGRWQLAFATEERGAFLDAISFWDERSGLALSDPVGGRFFLLRTDDGGATWKRVDPERLPPVLPGEAAFAASGSSLVLLPPGHVWIGTGGGGRGRVMHSSDRGLTWSVTDTPVHADGAAAGIFSLAFVDTLTGVAVGGDYTQPRLAAASVALTRDGGRTWIEAEAPPAAYLSGVAYAGSVSTLVAVGLAGTFVSRDGGLRWSQSDTVALNSVRFAGKRGIAVGPRGRVAYTGAAPR
jgi:photosystem II stability/assembly factor-like uncharacterized protein